MYFKIKMKKTIVLITLFMLIYLKLLNFFTCTPRFPSTNPKICLFNQQLYIYTTYYIHGTMLGTADTILILKELIPIVIYFIINYCQVVTIGINITRICNRET